MDLSAFVGKLLEEQDGDVLREGIRVLSQALMETEVAGLIGAERHERTADRTAHRNGYRMRTWDTPVGTIELAIPKVRPETYFPSLLQPRRRAENAPLAVVQEAYVHRVSTRIVDELMKALGLDGVSRSEVSRICGELDPLVEALRTRALTTEYPYLWVDATYHKVRINRRVTSQATVVAVGATVEGERQVLGIDVGALRGPRVLDGVSPQLGEARSPRSAARDLRCARRAQAGDRHGAERGDVAAVSGPFHA
jgi:transposase-like protein